MDEHEVTKPLKCPRCGWPRTHYSKEMLAALPEPRMVKRVLPLLVIWAVIAIPLALLFIAKGISPGTTMLIFVILTISVLWNIVKGKQGIPIGDVYHCTCDSCGHKWEMSGIQKHFLDNGQPEEAEKWNFGDLQRELDKRDKK